MGTSSTKFFADHVPCVTDLIVAVRDSYVSLGASSRPQLRHWTRLLVSIGEEYESKGKPLSVQRRDSIRAAYKGMKTLPTIPEDVPWLLDRDGRLHSTKSARSSNFLIDNEPTLCDALRHGSADIAFADAADPTLLAFFNMAGVKSLADVRQRVRQTIGRLRTAPPWFDEARVRDALTKPAFLNAVETIVLHSFGMLTGQREHFRAATRRLRTVRAIKFVETLSVYYRVGSATAFVPARATWKDEVVYLTFVRSRSEMNGLLAGLVAEAYLDRVSEQRSLADGVYRLLTSDSDRDLYEYLNTRGIRLKSDFVADQEEETNSAIDEKEQFEEAVHSALVKSYETLTQPSPRPIDRDIPTPSPLLPDETDHIPEPTLLPPLEEVQPVISEPAPAWSFAKGTTKTGTSGIWGGTAPVRDLERDRSVGRRGEEIILRMERCRVRDLGFSEGRVRWFAEEFPTADFDILSVDEDGEDLTIEVKATTGSDGRFHWSRAEFQRALRERGRYVLYRVYRATSLKPVVRAFRDPAALLAIGTLRLNVEVFHGEVEPL